MTINIQPIEKSCFTPGTLDVHHIFGPTIQGEGPFAGEPAVFIRLAGCNLQCPGCDTDYTSSRKSMFIETIVEAVENLHRSPYLVVISGGEPFRQNIGPLAKLLLKARYKVQIETNGTLYVPGPWKKVTIVCSPKTGKIHYKLSQYIDAYKYVLAAEDVSPLDGLPMRGLHQTSAVIARPPRTFKGTVYISPVDTGWGTEQNNRNLNAVKRSCLHYGYTLCLQLHKYLGME